MSQPVQYITNELGERVGVVLDLPSYARLTETQTTDENLLIGLSLDELSALASCKLAVVEQSRLDELIAQNAAISLTPEEETELDLLLAKADQLTILKTRAQYTLSVLRGEITAAWVFIFPAQLLGHKSKSVAIATKIRLVRLWSNASIMAAKLKKGKLVKVLKEQFVDSVEAKASDARLPSYLFESKGEILDFNDEYALVRFYTPTPSVWLRIDQLEVLA